MKTSTTTRIVRGTLCVACLSLATAYSAPVDIGLCKEEICTPQSPRTGGDATVDLEKRILKSRAVGGVGVRRFSSAEAEYRFRPLFDVPANLEVVIGRFDYNGILKGCGGGNNNFGRVIITAILRDVTNDNELDREVLLDEEEPGTFANCDTAFIGGAGAEALIATFDVDLVKDREFGLTIRVDTSAEGNAVFSVKGESDFSTGLRQVGFGCLTITPGPDETDTDEDGLYDIWEICGIDMDGDGVPEFTLDGADPLRKDIFVEIDYMGPPSASSTSHKPSDAAIAEVIKAFDMAPVPNPGGEKTGIKLHLDMGDKIPHKNNITTWTDFDDLKCKWFGTEEERCNDNNCDNPCDVLNAKRQAYRYALFVHKISNGSGGWSGLAEGANDFIVSLGASGWGEDPLDATHHIGTFAQQAGTLMHELGHTLGLGHGGRSGCNCKPNHLSVMNYLFQTAWEKYLTRLDYSRKELKTLDEDDLDEVVGINAGMSIPTGAVTRYSPDNGVTIFSGSANGKINWDGMNPDPDSDTVSVDINRLRIRGCDLKKNGDPKPSPGQCANNSNNGDKLVGSKDWEDLAYNFRDHSDFADGVHTDSDIPELNDEDAARLLNQPPVAHANGPYREECQGEVTVVQLDGTGSFDPDGDPITYQWTTGCPGGVFDDPTNATPTLTVAGPPPCPVVCKAKLTVTDPMKLSDIARATVTIKDTTPPEITCTPDVTITCGESSDPADIGMTIGSDVCTDVVITFSDVFVRTTCPADPVQEVVTRTWTVTDECGNTASCDQVITVLKRTASLIIKQGACPAPLNRDSHGVLPVLATGDVDFDATQIDTTTVVISRADCVGGSSAPNDGPPGPLVLALDLNHPYDGPPPCSCNDDESSDGIDDLWPKFPVTEMVEALQLDGLPNGALPELCVTGSLNDGSFAPSGDRCEFIACDCVRLVPPGTAAATMFITSTVSGAWIDVSPLDMTLDDGGFADFERSFPETTVVTLIASAWHSTTSETDSEAETSSRFWFTGWRVDGEILPEAGLTLVVEVSTSMQIEAVYEAHVAAPISATAPHDIPKNRFISVDPNNPDAVSLRVELLDLACSVTGKKCNSSSTCKACVGGSNAGNGCSTNSDCAGGTCVLSGEICEEQSPPVLLGWVSDPFEAGGDALPGTFTSEVVSTQPAARTWTESVVHIGDCEIAPVRTYGISATANGTLFSDPLIVGTIEKPQGKFWGDIVGNFNGVEWSPPNGLVGVDDVNAMIKFLTLKPAPHITVVDLVGSGPSYVNFDVNATDLLVMLKAFGGQTFPPVPLVADGYPADGDVTQCP